MEDFKKILEKNKLVLLCSADEDSDCESLSDQQSKIYNKNKTYASNEIFDVKYIKGCPNKKRNGEKRLPTRKPDPNVYNRNALLARENRKRKKIYVETIEKELDIIRKENRALAKALGRQLKIAERLEEEKRYYENIVKNRFQILGFDNALSSHNIQRAEVNLITAENTKDDIFKDVMDVTSSRICSPNEADNLSMLFDSASDGSVVAPQESSGCDFSSFDFSFPEFFTDLYESADVNLPLTATTWDDIWGDKAYNADNLISSNLILQNNDDVQCLNVDHCYARGPTRSSLDSSDQECDPSDCNNEEEICLCTSNEAICANCHILPTCRTPPIQLLNKQSF